MILHTERGEPLESRQVTASFRAFLRARDPETGKVTSMTLRASFATAMLQKHRRVETLGLLSEDAFLEYLSKVMNTSVEQLKEIYLSTNVETFEACAEIM